MLALTSDRHRVFVPVAAATGRRETLAAMFCGTKRKQRDDDYETEMNIGEANVLLT